MVIAIDSEDVQFPKGMMCPTHVDGAAPVAHVWHDTLYKDAAAHFHAISKALLDAWARI